MLSFNEFKTKAKWSPNSGLDSAANYSGPDLSNFLKGPSEGRDAEIMEQSNFASALDMLGGESETVQVHRFGHWACGWFETILVDPRDRKATKILYEIYKSLENYPVLDESDFCERENEYHFDYAKGAAPDLAKAIVLHFALPAECETDEYLIEACIDLNIECQRYYGNDSCINVYDMREPNESDIERLRQCVSACTRSSNPYLEFLEVVFGMRTDETESAV